MCLIKVAKKLDFHFDSEAIHKQYVNFPLIQEDSENTDSKFFFDSESFSESIQKLT